MRKLYTIALLVMIVAVFAPLSAAEAQDPQPDVPWQVGRWFDFGGITATGPVDGPAQLQVLDIGCAGDVFSVLVDGVDIGMTSAVPTDTDPGGRLICSTVAPSIEAALADPVFSKGLFLIPDGPHTVTIQHKSGFDGGAHLFRFLAAPPPPAFINRALTAVCIDSALAQNDPGLLNAQVGSVDISRNYFITTGGPTCGFGCIDGWDINCDGKIGDFCPVELDRTKVADVAGCLGVETASDVVQAAADTVQASVAANAGASEAATTTPESVPASVPASIPVTAELAHTGTETAFGLAGSALLCYGAVAVGCARHLRSRRRNRD